MPHQPTAPPGVRIFARVDRFVVECPACGALTFAHTGPTSDRAHLRGKRTQRARGRPRTGAPYNAYTQRLQCSSCERTFGVGLILWPVPRSGRKYLQPADTKPTRRQLAEIRQRAVGVWAEQIKAAGEAVNVAVTSECICPEPDGWATACPIHGIQASLSESAEPPEAELGEGLEEEEEIEGEDDA